MKAAGFVDQRVKYRDDWASTKFRDVKGFGVTTGTKKACFDPDRPRFLTDLVPCSDCEFKRIKSRLENKSQREKRRPAELSLNVGIFNFRQPRLRAEGDEEQRNSIADDYDLPA